MTLTGRTGTAVVVAAIVSLCLNMLLAGMMIGGRWHDGPGRHGRFGMAGFMERLPDEARPVVKQAFDAHKAEFDAQRQQVDAARQKVADLLKADTIDRPQLEQALNEMSQRMQAMYGLGRQVMLDVAEKLPPDQRREIVDRWLEERAKRDK